MKRQRLTRRRALTAGAAMVFAPSALTPDSDPELVNVNDFVIDVDPRRWRPSTVAKVIASWELQTQQQDRPDDWRSLRYIDQLQWCGGHDQKPPLYACYGVGPPEWTAAHVARLSHWLELKQAGRILAAERVGRGHAFAIVWTRAGSPVL
ncbi:MAG TPA: hypothetical protein VG713_02050 [Pirellulales bacterium]|nr:hypothetical protein [Pirellulales bacterium]